MELLKTHRWHLWSTSGGLDKVLSLTLRSFSLFLYFSLLLAQCSFTTPSNISPGICHPFPCVVSLYPDAQHVRDEMWAPDPLQQDQRRTFSSTAAYCVQQSNSGLDWFDLLSSSSSSMWLDRDGRPLIAATGEFWSFFFCSAQCLNCWPGGCLGSPAFSRSPVVRRAHFAVSPAVSLLSVYCKDA